MIDNNNWIAILCVTLMACVALVVLKIDAKDIVIAAVSGILGFISNSAIAAIKDRRTPNVVPNNPKQPPD